MKKITLFSALTDNNKETILSQIIPAEMLNKTIAYMPSGGTEGAQEYIKQWGCIARNHGAKFNVIDNLIRSETEKNKLLDSNILVISGGNTFNLLHNLRRSGLDMSIKQFLEKQSFVLSGYSAGALVLTPTIEICNLPGFDENLIGLKDLSALKVVDFEIFPHYKKDLHEKMLEDYRNTTRHRVREITDEDYINIDL